MGTVFNDVPLCGLEAITPQAIVQERVRMSDNMEEKAETYRLGWRDGYGTAVKEIATQAAAIEALESKLDYPHEEIAELEGEKETMYLNMQVLVASNAVINREHTALVEAARAVLTLPVPSNIQALAALIDKC